jgi:aspartate dehydrogenase
MVLKIGLVGCGAIGSEIAKSIDQGKISALLVAVCDHNPDTAKELIDGLKAKPVRANLEELVNSSDLVVEAASQRAVPAIARATLEKGKSLMIMSVGALADLELYRSIKKMASVHGSKVYLPSGAISGLAWMA